jgi:diguanylate cyclase
VESAKAWNRLVSLGCDIAQGYYLSRPVPADQLTEWLRERAAKPRERRLRSA